MQARVQKVKQYVSSDTVRFLTDIRFIRYVLEDNIDLQSYWHVYLAEHEGEREAFLNAEEIIRNLDKPQNVFSPRLVEQLRVRIKSIAVR